MKTKKKNVEHIKTGSEVYLDDRVWSVIIQEEDRDYSIFPHHVKMIFPDERRDGSDHTFYRILSLREQIDVPVAE